MNFLAHLYLSGESEPIMIGNFIGDFVKGNKINDYDEEIIRGIRMHRAIDAYTDKHEVVKMSKSKLSRYRHYAGVITDIYYDHFLAANWDMYHSEELKNYVDRSYELMVDNQEILPDRVNHMLKYMIPQNWLLSYREVEGIGEALQGLSRRTKFDSGMEHAIEDLSEHYDTFEEEFHMFFSDLMDYAARFEE